MSIFLGTGLGSGLFCSGEGDSLRCQLVIFCGTGFSLTAEVLSD